MAIAKLNLLDIEFPQSASDSVLLKLINLDGFHPEPASKFVDSVQGLSVLNRENIYADLLANMDEAKERFKIQYKKEENMDTKLNIIQSKENFEKIINDINAIEKVRKDLIEMINENEGTIKQLEHMINSGFNFDDLFACKYLQVRFGTIPTANLDKLQYFGIEQFLFKSFHKDPKTTYCMYITTIKKAPEIDNMFSSLYFERIMIPNYVHGTVQEALDVLKGEDTTARNYLNVLQERIDKILNDNIDMLSHIYNVANRLNEIYDAQKYVVVFGANSAIYGFCEIKDAQKIKKYFEDIEDVHVEIKSALGDSRLVPPTKLKSNFITKPFKMFVEMYGVPSYTDFDPTNLVAITYTILFGIMFGDVGQGLLLSLVGYIAYKWKGMQLGAVGVRLGISSAIFGVVFGSVFGSEEILQPFFMPMESSNTMPLLLTAVGVGVVLIIISIAFNIIINAKKKNYGEMLFSQNGIAGFIFYVSVIVLVISMMSDIITVSLSNPLYIGLLIILPIIIIFLKEPLTRKLESEPLFPEGIGGFLVESIFELVEIVLTFITNTMSFLRVGGFVLSHAGMMLVVYTLANMVGGGNLTIGYFLVLIFGNIFVMCLEGMIVGIQVLRLEFYEMFSRYYEGNGKAFVTIKER